MTMLKCAYPDDTRWETALAAKPAAALAVTWAAQDGPRSGAKRRLRMSEKCYSSLGPLAGVLLPQAHALEAG